MSGLNSTPSGERIHIAFFGNRNAGKSSLVNAFTGQEISIVSDTKGTTTDPVSKSMELLPLGPVKIIDTAGLDDEGTLGEMRVSKTLDILNKTDIAVIVSEKEGDEAEILKVIKEKNIPFIICKNKADLLEKIPEDKDNIIYVSAKTGYGIEALKEKVASLSKKEERVLVSDLIDPLDTVILVVPIDKSAPKGRLILPQQQTIRDILDSGAMALVCRDSELEAMLQSLKEPPALVITDSQVFGKVSKIVPKDIPLTSFSILFARYKGNLWGAVNGAFKLDSLQDGDKILIAEGCTHHRQCGDIGTVKLPKWINEYTSKKLEFEFTSGRDFPEDVSDYALIIHCGGCMLTEREMQYRIRQSEDASVPITNYGMVIAHTHGILRRSLEPFVEK
jgi:[FeFe] hydrogenase H-cluster maturation GTPase HydF